MINLIENAAKYSDDGRTITIITLHTDKYVIIKVQDEGIGISDEFKEKIFEKFSRIDNPLTRRVQGSGLGLYITKNLVEKMGLSEDILKKFPTQLSGGEQQRIAMIRAIINKPAVLFADEPSGNLDTRTKDEIHKLFFDLRERTGQTIIIVTHDPELASMCDRCLYMRDGQFVDDYLSK